MRLVTAFAIAFFIGPVTMGAGSRLVALLAETAQLPIQQVLLIRCVRIVTGGAFSTHRRRVRNRHIQLCL